MEVAPACVRYFIVVNLCVVSLGTGKTSLAVHLTTLMTFDYIRMITASELLALPDAHKIDKIHHAFTQAYR